MFLHIFVRIFAVLKFFSLVAVVDFIPLSSTSHSLTKFHLYIIFAVLKIPHCSVSRKLRYRFCLLSPSLIRTLSLRSTPFYGIFAVLKIPHCSVSRKLRYRFCLLSPSLIRTHSLRSTPFYGIFA